MLMELGKWHWDDDLVGLHVKSLELQRIGRLAKEYHIRNVARQATSLKVPETRTSSKDNTDLTKMESLDVGSSVISVLNAGAADGQNEARRSIMLNDCRFMSAALRETQIARSRCGSPTGSRAGSRMGTPEVDELDEASTFNQKRKTSVVPRSRENSVSHVPTGPRKNSAVLDDVNFRKNSVSGRRNSGVLDEISSLAMPAPADLNSQKDSLEAQSARRTGSKPVNKGLEREELRRQARDRLRARKSDGTGIHGVQDDAQTASTATGDRSTPEKNESSLVQEVQRLAGNLQHRLEGKRSTHMRRRHSKEVTSIELPKCTEVKPQVIENNVDGCKRMSMSIPEVPLMEIVSQTSGVAPGKAGPTRSSARKVVGDLSCGNLC
jgi:hypothetical protein